MNFKVAKFDTSFINISNTEKFKEKIEKFFDDFYDAQKIMSSLFFAHMNKLSSFKSSVKDALNDEYQKLNKDFFEKELSTTVELFEDIKNLLSLKYNNLSLNFTPNTKLPDRNRIKQLCGNSLSPFDIGNNRFEAINLAKNVFESLKQTILNNVSEIKDYWKDFNFDAFLDSINIPYNNCLVQIKNIYESAKVQQKQQNF